ncbi:hypothetical protein OG884_25700 [Streptosporangium sp. NBC_01755]|uniref:hypothetical protein n=1 Tax=unclassified Streptosporangium TaxID=2632669 RepID=UPI002DDA2A4A|nr:MULTISPECIES: hypothetical protein [unclassified Streptosporangium]WSA23538.1 hypothetical protein OIE13_21530 [Streptosporangium sp. NBC_01810]WSC98254.1 hypothetical protein OG884_25700 [Streptosporangium sp. NBC_01755]
MRPKRFEMFMKDQLTGSGSDSIKSVATFDEIAFTSKPCGLQIEFVTGARVMLQIVRSSPPGGEDFGQDEKVIEGEALEPVPGVDVLITGGKLNVESVERYLTVLLTNSGNREIKSLRPFVGKGQKYGINVGFHSGANCYIHFLYTLPNGKETNFHPEFNVLEVV